MVGWGSLAGVAALGVATLIASVGDGSDMFLAGRLDGPVNYRNATALLFAIGFWPLICFGAARGGYRGLRAAALSAATLELGLAFLTQSRGVLLGLTLGALVAMGSARIVSGAHGWR